MGVRSSSSRHHDALYLEGRCVGRLAWHSDRNSLIAIDTGRAVHPLIDLLARVVVEDDPEANRVDTLVGGVSDRDCCLVGARREGALDTFDVVVGGGLSRIRIRGLDL